MLGSLGGSDVESARRVLEQAGVQQRVPRPRLGEWWRDVLARIAEVLTDLFDLSSSTVRSLLTLASWGLIVLAAVVLLGWAAAVILRRREGLDEASSQGVTTVVASALVTEEEWERRLREALETRDVSAALRAQWQVLFSRLRAQAASAGAGPAPSTASWTTRALVRRLGATSQGAASALRRLERWTYGGRRPQIEELRGLAVEFEALLPRPLEHDA